MCTVWDHIFLGIKYELHLKDVKEQGAEEKKGQVTKQTTHAGSWVLQKYLFSGSGIRKRKISAALYLLLVDYRNL